MTRTFHCFHNDGSVKGGSQGVGFIKKKDGIIRATWSSFCKKRVMFCGWTLDVASSFSVLLAARTGAFRKGRTGVAV